MTDTDAGSTDDIVAETVELLKSFELTEYEAKCFVALARIGQGTAKEASEVADVPQARVYDCMETLQDRGLVDVQQSKPRQYRGSDSDDALDTIERRVDRKLERLQELLPQLREGERGDDGGEIWVTDGSDEVAERMATLVEATTDEVMLAVAALDLLTDDLLDALAAAADAGVDVTVGSPDGTIRERVTERVADATVVETWTWWETVPIRNGAVSSVLMTDGEALLVSADAPTELPSVRTHRAVWTDSGEAPLVGMMRPLLANAIRGEVEGTAAV
ncbi:TrmB family transcriptional regulator [Haloarchaeobius iranensis]|uniref:Sugar-specific transcriptional regulator TrmB n=1 Tax=Haloarchaeobius iranensis TaxID=996166 RepID=A0A1G9UGS3_9EURY|nr:helix-turn-helix domain-containing protein [Haloarchaeobius iranensis]SDM59111.1 Sugar-specific transcriptional regulator TrmB [Haloarchaeobius iranensis]